MIDLLFPRPVLKLESFISNKECAIIEIELKQLKSNYGTLRSESNNIDSSFHNLSNLHQHDSCKNLGNKILEYGRLFLEKLSYDKFVIENCKIHKMWFNISYENDYIFPHTHGDCLIAGVLYVKAPIQSQITFYDSFDKIKLKRQIYNEFSYEEFSYNCENGLLLMFENNMIHGNKKQPPGEKIAISFNIGL